MARHLSNGTWNVLPKEIYLFLQLNTVKTQEWFRIDKHKVSIPKQRQGNIYKNSVKRIAELKIFEKNSQCTRNVYNFF